MSTDAAVEGAAEAAAEVAAAALASWAWLCDRMPDAWSVAGTDFLAVCTGLPAPTLNGVWCTTEVPDPVEVGRLLDRMSGAGLPHCVQFPAGAVDLGALAEARGMAFLEAIPLMRLEAVPGASRAGTSPGSGLRVRRLSPAEVPRHASLAAAGFGAPEAIFTPMVTPVLAASPEMAFYVGEVDDIAVVTGLGVHLGDSVGVFNVATLPDHRGHGYGLALTTQIAADGFAAGAHWCWLQSSADGLGVYRRLGFREVTRWDCWVTP